LEHTPLAIRLTLHTRVLQCLLHKRSDLRTSRRIILDLIALWWKSAIVVVQLMLAPAAHSNLVSRPMRRDQQNSNRRIRRPQLEDLWHLVLERLGDFAVLNIA
jgi:hypothetical protein